MNTFETVVDAFVHHARYSPSKLAFTVLVDGDRLERRYTFGQLFEESIRVGGALSGLAAAGERVVLVLPPGPEFLPCLWGSLWAGLVPCVVYPPGPGGGAQALAPIAAIARDSQATLAITLGPVLDRLGHIDVWKAAGLPELVCYEELATHTRSSDRRPTLLSHLQYTSGSTAVPKGVRVRHSGLAKHCEQMSGGFGWDSDSVGVYWLPTHHSFGMVAAVMVPMYLGHRSVLFSPEQFLQRPLRWLEALSRYRGTATGGPNFAYDLVTSALERGDAARDPIDLSACTVAAWGGEAVQPSTLTRVRDALGKVGLAPTALTPAYGLSEITLSVSGSAPGTFPSVLNLDGSALQRGELIEVGSSQGDSVRSVVGLGLPLQGHDLRIVDPETREIVQAGRIGEIWLRGPSVADGYWNRPDETAAVFGGYLADSTGPFLRTGDLGFLHRGEVFVTGRCKELIIVRGLKYFPADIEATVRASCPALATAPVAAFPWLGPDGEALGVAVETDAPAPELIEALRSQIAREHGVECGCVALSPPGALPRTGSGKLKRLIIAQLARDVGLPGMLRVETERGDVAEFPALWGPAAFAAVLRAVGGMVPSVVEPQTRLADISLSSLSVVRAVAEIELRYGHRLPMEALLSKTLTVDELLRSVNDRSSPRAASYLADAQLAVELAERIRAPRAGAYAGGGEDILVTGATGYLGANILHDLLARTQRTIHCLVRHGDSSGARDYLRDRVQRLTGRSLPDSRQIRVVIGDITQPKFGLDAATYDALAVRVGSVLHAAAHVNFAYPYKLLRAVNVAGTIHTLEFCADKRLKRLHFLSTAAVLATGNFETPVRPERSALELRPELEMGYAQSKWVADRLVGLARVEGMPAFVYRVGFVGGRSTDGELLRRDEFFPSFLRGCVELGEYPVLPFGLASVPVDWVAEVIAEQLVAGTGTGIDLHLVHPQPMSITECFQRIAARGYRLTGVPFDVWKAHLLEQPPSQLRKSALFDFLSFLRPVGARHFAPPSIAFDESRRMWAEHPCPDAAPLLDRCVDRLIAEGALPPSPGRG